MIYFLIIYIYIFDYSFNVYSLAPSIVKLPLSHSYASHYLFNVPLYRSTKTTSPSPPCSHSFLLNYPFALSRTWRVLLFDYAIIIISLLFKYLYYIYIIFILYTVLVDYYV